jgi:hypothetical protein
VNSGNERAGKGRVSRIGELEGMRWAFERMLERQDIRFEQVLDHGGPSGLHRLVALMGFQCRDPGKGLSE